MNKATIERYIVEKGERCWDSIGIYGSGTCELLDTYEHCRSCPIYLFSGRQLFKKEVNSDFVNDWTKIYSQEKENSEEQKKSLVIFRIQNEWFALDTALFQEAISNKLIHIVPSRTNQYLYGVVNVNGELFLSVSMESLLGLQRVANNDLANKKLLVLNIEEQKYCFPIDEFGAVISVKLDSLEDIPNTLEKIENNLIINVFKNEYRSKLNNMIEVKQRTISLICHRKLLNLLNRCLIW